MFKMDIEGPEWSIFETMDIDYACQYFKQLIFETHLRDVPKSNFKNYELIKKLEKCFLLFHRDTRFYNPINTKENGALTEFQKSYAFDLRKFGTSDLQVICYMLSVGELYFVNKSFLQIDSSS